MKSTTKVLVLPTSRRFKHVDAINMAFCPEYIKKLKMENLIERSFITIDMNPFSCVDTEWKRVFDNQKQKLDHGLVM
jgi:hypothetical protein